MFFIVSDPDHTLTSNLVIQTSTM